MKEFPESQSMTETLNQIRILFDKAEVDPQAVQKVLSQYKSNEADWAKYAQFDPHRYTRNLVDAGNGKYNIMILCWGEGMASGIHDHPGCHCFVKVLDGTVRETRYHWPEKEDEPMRLLSSADAERDDVTYIHDRMGLHRMENPSHTDGAVTLHIYVPPYQECRTFDIRTSKTSVVKMTFWTKYGQRTSDLKDKMEPGPGVKGQDLNSEVKGQNGNSEVKHDDLQAQSMEAMNGVKSITL